MDWAAKDLALVHVGEGGLLLNLRTGVVFELNDSARLIWRGLLAGESPRTVARTLVARYGLAEGGALNEVTAAQAVDLSQAASYPPLVTDFHYERGPSGYVFSFLGEAVLQVDAGGTEVKLATADGPPRLLEQLLLAMVPKIAALRGGTVLHASAFLDLTDQVTAFSGESGAGKTTAARAVTDAGARLVSEDKLVLSPTVGPGSVLIEGERRLEAWVAHAAAEVASTGRASCAGLGSALGEGPTRPLGSILFIDATRRGGDLVFRRLDRPAAAAAIFHNTFFGSDLDEDWRQMLERSAALGRDVAAFSTTMPAGLPYERGTIERLATGTFRSK